MKAVVLEPLGVSEEKIRSAADKALCGKAEYELYTTKTTDTDELIARGKDADILVLANMPLKEEVLKGCPKVKMISVAFTGVDHIPMQYCKENNITVSNCAGYSTTAVSELVFGLLLDVYRNISTCNSVARKSGTKDGLVGNEIKGKKFGIVGTGAIGLQTAKIAQAFGCEVYAYSRTVKDIDGITYLSLDELLSTCDIVSLHVPLNDSTKGLINADNIKLMKKNAVLINTARGPVVDSAALADALNSGAIAGAGIDVFENEPPVAEDHPLFKTPRTVVTPHVAFATKEALETRADMVFENITAYLNGSPINVM